MIRRLSKDVFGEVGLDDRGVGAGFSALNIGMAERTPLSRAM
jgi:hypothetical protein